MRTVERLSYFQFYVADYLLDTPDLSLAQHGAYLTLMLRYYWEGGLTRKDAYRNCKASDDKKIVDEVVERFFHFEGDRLTHNRIDRELERLARYVEHQSHAGIASGVARSGKKKQHPKKRINGSPVGFDLFYDAYPVHEKRADAEKAWIRIAPDEVLRERIMQAVEVQKRSPKWLKDNGAFIPHPTSWLNAKRWEDEVAPTPTKRVAI